jgi:hypothetical protein
VGVDQEGFAMFMLSGRAFSVSTGTKVRVLDHFGFLSTTAQVRILEGWGEPPELDDSDD